MKEDTCVMYTLKGMGNCQPKRRFDCWSLGAKSLTSLERTPWKPILRNCCNSIPVFFNTGHTGACIVRTPKHLDSRFLGFLEQGKDYGEWGQHPGWWQRNWYKVHLPIGLIHLCGLDGLLGCSARGRASEGCGAEVFLMIQDLERQKQTAAKATPDSSSQHIPPCHLHRPSQSHGCWMSACLSHGHVLPS